MGTLKRIKHLLANKGGIGASLSREDSIQRLNPLVRRHMETNYAYDAAIQRLSKNDVASELNRHQKIARADVGKLRETILSMGGVADNGVDLRPNDFSSDSDDDALLADLRDREQKLLDAVNEELGLDLPEHQIRTLAILQNVQAHSKERLDFLKEQVGAGRRPTSSSESTTEPVLSER